MGIEKFTGWKTADGTMFNTEQAALNYEARLSILKVVCNCTYDGNFHFDDFITEIRADEDLIATLGHLVSP